MIKKITIAVLAAFITLGTFSITEAAQADSHQNYCGRDGHCYNQNYHNNNNDSDYRGGYGCGGHGY